jgi:hypothetical protein
MTLDEAIKHCEEVAEGQMKSAEMWKEYPENKYDCHLAKKAYDSCKKCSDEHRQLAAWLRELKAYKEQEPCNSCCGGDQKEKAKLCQKSYLAGMEHRQELCEDAISRKTVCAKITNGAYPGESTEQCIENGQKAYKRTTGWVSDTI